ncbi:MAG: ATPase [Clostridia bacterium]|nr:ATPase [Clostridia bacterium]
MSIIESIQAGKTALGIEFGSTRIKAVLIGPDRQPIASGAHEWQDSLVDGVWTYSLEKIHAGLTDCYQSLKKDVQQRYGVKLSKVGSMGVSAMMHGYLPFDADMNLLSPFRTWRNTITGPAAQKLTALMQFNIPQRWSIAHLEQAIMNGESHVKDIRHLTTLAGYAHYLLTGEKVLGVGDAAGMFPIDSAVCDYDADRLTLWQNAHASDAFPWQLKGILPKVLPAGAKAGQLTEAGARFLDPDGDLQPGVPFCPPEGDAGTGMVATNSVAVRTGNVSAGTSVFAMIVLEKPLKALHEEIDMVTTPSGDPVAMVHCNTCTSDLNAWAGLLGQAAELLGARFSANELYTALFRKALEGSPDCDGLTAYNYYSGEPITGTSDGVPLFTRRPDLPMNLGSFMRAQINSALATLSIGMEILTKDEQVSIDSVLGHGGLFKTPGVGQRLLAAAIGIPVTVMETAGEGGAWGIALLADYAADHAEAETLERWLKDKVFAGMTASTIAPEAADTEGFAAYIARYRAALPAEKAACTALKG